MKIPRYDPVRADETIREEIDFAIAQVLDNGLFINGPAVTKFSARVSRMFLGGRYVLACANGTDALGLVYSAARERYGGTDNDLVIVPTLTFAATASAVELAGMKPVISCQGKIDPFVIDYDDLAERLDSISYKSNIVAFTVVHLYGRVTLVPDSVKKLLEERSIALVEDACQAFGGSFKSVAAGTQGFGAAFSFFPSKPLGCYGDGGLCVFENMADWEYAAMLARHGSRLDNKYESITVGRNSRLDTIQAAILDVKLSYCNEARLRRMEIARRYTEAFEEHLLAQISTPILTKGHAMHCYTVRVDHGLRDELMAYLRAQGIDAAVVYPLPLHAQPAFSGMRRTGLGFKEAEEIASEILTLPCWDGMTSDEINTVISSVIDFYRQ